MSDQPESLAAILAEMREYFDLLKRGLIPDNVARMTTRQRHQFWADRIEAAAEREREAVRGARDMRDAMEYAFAQKTPKVEQSGNAAREAWKNICAACAEGTPPERCAYYGEPNGCNAPTLGAHPEGDLAERLQEALEKAERRIAELERVTGNAAAMRAALVRIAALRPALGGFVEPIDGDSSAIYQNARWNGKEFLGKEIPACWGAKWRNDLANVIDTAHAALAAPARNCDRTECRTRDEAWKVFERESAGMWAANWDAAFSAWLFDTKEEGVK